MSLAVFTWVPNHPNRYRDRKPVKTYAFVGSLAQQRFTLAERKLRVYRLPFRFDAASGKREAIDAFSEARGILAESFLYKDLKDYARTGITLEPAAGNGVIVAFSLPTTGPYSGDYPVDDAHAIVSRGATPLTTLSVQTDARTITVTAAPAAGAAITGAYWYYRRVVIAEEFEWSEANYNVFDTEIVLEEVGPS